MTQYGCNEGLGGKSMFYGLKFELRTFLKNDFLTKATRTVYSGSRELRAQLRGKSIYDNSAWES